MSRVFRRDYGRDYGRHFGRDFGGQGRTARRVAGAAALALGLVAGAAATGGEDGGPRAGGIHVVPAADGAPARDMVSGRVFEDADGDGAPGEGEAGLEGVLVTNGREVVATGADGGYALPAFDNMTVSVVQPAGFRVPVDANRVPQFAYHHLPDGTPETLRYGGLPASGPLPAAIDFPLLPTQRREAFSCVVMGDTQPYTNTEVGYVRDSIVTDLLALDLDDAACLILVGDVMGDDLGLLPRFMEVLGLAGLPQYYVHGNHDFDFDATSDAHSADSWRRLYGPNYYAFEIGDVLFVALDNVVYPCTGADIPADLPPGDDRLGCGGAGEPIYNGRVPERQMTWLANLLGHVPEDRLVVLMHHIPLVSFIDQDTGRHQTDNAAALHALVAGRPALSLSGHTHTLEQLATGAWYRGWTERVQVERLPFPHVVVGAPSGNWWSQDLDVDGVPMSFGRLGAPRGFLVFDFDGTGQSSRFYGANLPPERQMWLSFNTPRFRAWYEALMAHAGDAQAGEIPPYSIHDLGDTRLFTPEDLAAGVDLAANVWNGDRETVVTVRLNGGEPRAMSRTQQGDGEALREGALYADPFAASRQLSVARYAFVSTEGDPRAQGFALWQDSRFGPSAPGPMLPWMIADQSLHLWTLRLPEDLPEGAHVAAVSAVDRHGRRFTDHIAFEVRAERPDPYWRGELWEGVE
jgi:hypothetical protein